MLDLKRSSMLYYLGHSDFFKLNCNRNMKENQSVLQEPVSCRYTQWCFFNLNKSKINNNKIVHMG